MAPSILKTLTAAAGFYASLAIAAPLHKRAIVWETETEVVVKTVTVTTTCSGTPGPDATIHPPTPTHQAPKVTPTFNPSRPYVSSSSISSSSSSSSIPPPPPPPPTSSAVPPPPPPPPAPTPKPNPPPQYNPPPKPTPTSTSKPPPPPPPPKPTVAPPPQVSVPPPPPPPPPAPTVAPKPPKPSPEPSTEPNPPSYGGGGGECSPGNPCGGEITFYDGGLGACGTQVSTESEDAIALPHAFMGTESNNNQYCGKTVTIKLGKVTATATIKDKCMGCTGHAIDMTRHLFYQFGDESDGRLDGAVWYINE